MDISIDIHGKSVDMDMDMDGKFHIRGKPGNIGQFSRYLARNITKQLDVIEFSFARPPHLNTVATLLCEMQKSSLVNEFGTHGVGLFYEGIGNEIGVEMALGEANKLNHAAAVTAVRALKDEEEAARLRAEQDELKMTQRGDDGAAECAGEDAAQTPEDTKGMCAEQYVGA